MAREWRSRSAVLRSTFGLLAVRGLNRIVEMKGRFR